MGNRLKEIEKYNAMLRKHIEKKHRVKFFRNFMDTEANLYGFILDMSEGFLLIQLESEFDLNGYSVIPIWAFDTLRYNKFDKAATKIMTTEGYTPGIEYEIDITGWQNVFKRLKELDKHVSIECEGKKEDHFYIGPIERVGKKSVRVRYYDPAGVLEEEATRINYDDILTVTFDDRYTTIFRKYLKEKGSQKRNARTNT